MAKTRHQRIVRFLIFGSLITVVILLVIVYFLAIKPAQDAIDEARLAVEGLPLEFEKNVVDLSKEYKAYNGGSLSISGYSEFNDICRYKEDFFIAGDGGLIKIVKGSAPLVKDVSNPYRTGGKKMSLNGEELHRLSREDRQYLRTYFENSIRQKSEIGIDSEHYCAGIYNISNGLLENRIKSLESWNGRLLLLYEHSGIAILEEQLLTNYRIRNSRYNAILALSTDKEKITMITDRADLIEFDGEKFKLLKNEVLNTKNKMITSVCRTEEGILIGTVNSGIYFYNYDKIENEASDLFTSNKINSILNLDGKIFLCTENGLYQRKAKNDYRVIIRDYPICSVSTNQQGTIMSGTYFGEIIQMQPNNLQKVIKISKEGNPVKSLLQLDLGQTGGSEDSIYAITDSEIFRMKSIGSRSRIAAGRQIKLLSANFITTIEKDNYGRIWLGYFDKGIDILDPNMSVIAHIENDDIRVIRHLKFDPDKGSMYAATSKGIIVIDSSFKYRKTDNSRGLINNEASHISFIKGGIVYCTAGGVTFDNGGLLMSVYAFHGLSNNHAYCSMEKEDKLYVGTLGGLSVIQKQKVVNNYTPLNSPLPNNWVTALLSDEAGNIWVGTYGGGISKIDGDGRWDGLEFPFKDIEINNNAMLSLDKMIIAGTLSDGIIAYDINLREWRKLSSALPSRNVTSFLHSGNELLIGTDAGLAILDLSTYK